MDKVAIYCRLSKEDKNINEVFDKSESIKNQISMLTTYAKRKGWEIYAIYNDDDYSGADINRPQFNKLIQDAEDKKFNIIICKTQSRFTRQIEQVEKYLHTLFPIWGIRFIGVVDNTDTFIKNNKKVRQIYGLTNEWYLEELSDNIRSVLNEKKIKGSHIGSFAPYGYKKDEKNRNHLVIDKVAATNVKKVFDLYSSGYSIDSIARTLNNENILPPILYKKSLGYNVSNFNKNGIWTHNYILTMLHNQIYIGNMVSNYSKKASYKSKKTIHLPDKERIIVENTHEPIISKQQFWKVQDIIKQKRRISKNGSPHIFAGKIKCMECNSSLVKKNDKYLRCSLYSQAPSKCTTHSIPIKDINQIVTYKLKEHINEYVNWNKILELLSKEKCTNNINILREEKNMLIKEVNLKDKSFKQMYEDMAKELITKEQFIFLNKNILEEKEKILKRINQIDFRLKEEKDENYNKKFSKTINIYKDFENLSINMVQEFIDTIQVGEKLNNKRTIKINWSF